ncbi:MAG TPA: HipA family kinase [Gemmatimonadaceae bacterium]|nr:HipA family kinase [Gemmatimonadaceae bacterium]
MQILDAHRVLSADKRGSSWPVLVETDAGIRFTKLRGAAQGTGALVAEVIIAEVAEALGLLVPARSLVRFSGELESVDKNDELADLLRASVGINLGFAYLEGARSFSPDSDVDRIRPDVAAAILWLDGLTTNPDRTARNPNLLWWHDELWLIDHGAALGFQYALPDVAPSAARRPYTVREPHLLAGRAADMLELDERFAALVPRNTLERALQAVPDEFLAPLIGDDRLDDRRAAYVEFLSARLDPPRPFLEPVLVQGKQRPARGRPAWLDRPR